MGGKAHSALLNCSPNDRRTSVRPRPFHRHQPSGTIRLVAVGSATAPGLGRAPIVAGLDLKGARSDASSPPCRSPIAPLYRRRSWTTRGADDRWGNAFPAAPGGAPSRRAASPGGWGSLGFADFAASNQFGTACRANASSALPRGRAYPARGRRRRLGRERLLSAATKKTAALGGRPLKVSVLGRGGGLAANAMRSGNDRLART
jgi:hypothetical protein